MSERLVQKAEEEKRINKPERHRHQVPKGCRHPIRCRLRVRLRRFQNVEEKQKGLFGPTACLAFLTSFYLTFCLSKLHTCV